MENTNPLKSLRSTHLLMSLSVLILSVIVFFVLQSGIEPVSRENQDILFKIVPMGVVIGISASYYLGKKWLLKARKAKGLTGKLGGLKTMLVIKNVCLIIPALLACLSAFMASEVQFLFIALAVSIVMFIAIPKKEKIVGLLELNTNEINELNKILSL